MSKRAMSRTLDERADPVTSGRFCEAVERGDVTAVREMLRRRPEIVDLDWPEHGEERPIHLAVLRRDPVMVRLLMESGADARRGIYPNRDATSAFTLAAERGDNELAAIIEEEEQRRGACLKPDAGEVRHDPREVVSGDQLAVIQRLEADPALGRLCDPGGWTPLHHAAGMLHTRVVQWLLGHGAEVNRRARGDWTPLDYAASGSAWDKDGGAERFEIVAKVLRRAGAELSAVSAVALGEARWLRARHAEGKLATARSWDGSGPFAGLLSIAVTHDRPEMLALLLELGLDPDERVRVEGSEDAVESWGMPLYICARSGRLVMAQNLLERGADPNGQVLASGSPTFVAYKKKDRAMIRLLLSHGGALDAASVGYLRQTELAGKMLAGEVDARLEYGKFSGQTVAEQLLWSGGSGGDPEIVRMALEQIDWRPDDPRWFWMLWRPLPGHSPRPEADRALYLDCFRQVLKRCDPNLRAPRFGQTMLHEVVARDQGEGVAFAKLLLEAGAKTDLRDDLLKSTPLGWACRWGRAALVKLLLERGADPVEAGAEPWAAPAAWAEKMGHETIAGLLRSRADLRAR